MMATDNSIKDEMVEEIDASSPAISAKKEQSNDDTTPSPSISYSLASKISRKHCIIISSLILLSHALFLWGQIDILWGYYVFYAIDGDVNATSNVTEIVMGYEFNKTSLSINEDNPYLIDLFDYGLMLEELWIYSRVTAWFLFIFSAFWPHLKLVLLHVSLYLPSPSKPRAAALYWLDSVGKMSLADVCATCMLFLLLNLSLTYNLGTFVNNAAELMANVVPYISDSALAKGLSNETRAILDEVGTWAYDEVVKLSDSIFADGNDPELYSSLLEQGCSEFYNGGETCANTTFYEPTTVTGGIAGIMAKCLRIRNDKCYQCQCIVNNAIFNHDVPGEPVQAAINDAISTTFAKLLASVKAGQIDFSSWFSFGGTATVGMYITIYPALLGFTFAVIFSVIASLVVNHVAEKHYMKRYRNASTLDESLENEGIDKTQWTQLFANSPRRLTRILAIICSLGLIPLVFFSLYVKMFDVSIFGLFEELLMVQDSATRKLYSIIDCVTAVNDGTGYGKTFAVFYGLVMLGIPMLRAVLLTVVSLVPLTPRWHYHLARTSNEIGSYIGWEPFFICVLLLRYELPSMTEDVVPPDACQEIAERDRISKLVSTFGLDTNTCFVMNFYVLPTFSLFVIAWAVLAGFNILVWKAVLKRYDPFGTLFWDRGGPYWDCRQCCHFHKCWKHELTNSENEVVNEEED